MRFGFDNRRLVLPPMLCASVGVYAAARACGNLVFDFNRKFDKRFKDSHRFAIADTRGRLEMTVPIAKPRSSSCSWGEIEISSHGEWWDVHRVALESAYGRTPYFEFYIDRLLPMLTPRVVDCYPLLKDLILAWDSWIRGILDLPVAVESALEAVNGTSRDDSIVGVARECDKTVVGVTVVCGKSIVDIAEVAASAQPYWQVRADKLGFIPNLSALDLIFNLGPEATLMLDNIASSIPR